MLERLLEEVARLVRSLPPPALSELQADHGADELLLGAVMQIAAESAALLIAGLDDSGPRGGKLLARINVGERGRNELREVGEPVLSPFGERPRTPARRDDAAPYPAGDLDRRADCGLMPAARSVLISSPRTPA